MQILFIAGTSLSKIVGYSCTIIGVKKPTTIRQSAGIRNNSYFEVSQRLNSGNLIYAFLVGLIEGDGWFTVTKKGKYLLYEFGIELNIRDVQLIYKIKSLLGVGVVSFRDTEGRAKTVSLRIRNKSHLIDVILPIFDKYPLLSNKQYDYLRFRDALMSGIKYHQNLPEYVRPKSPLNSVESILSVPYFSAWLVGFIEAESCFGIYKPTSSTSWIASFEVSQTNGELLILAICKHLSLTQKIRVTKTNSFSIKVSSVRSIENVMKFMQNAPVKLLGHKKLQYILWLKELRTITRYTNKINIPDNY